MAASEQVGGFSGFLRSRREQRGLTQGQLGELLETVSQQTVSAWENRRNVSPPSARNLRTMAGLFDVEPWELMRLWLLENDYPWVSLAAPDYPEIRLAAERVQALDDGDREIVLQALRIVLGPH